MKRRILVAVVGTLLGVSAASAQVGQWNANGTSLYYMGGNVGVGTSSPGYSFHVVNKSARTLVGENEANIGSTVGVWGQSASPGGSGVFGLASAITGTTTGVTGRSNSTSGKGVFGQASALTGLTAGVWGESMSTSGYGLYGLANAATGAAVGVRGESASTGGRGVIGIASAATGATRGVVGQSQSLTGVGVFGLASAASGANFGMVGQSNSLGGVGVYGLTTGAVGNTYGLLGESKSLAGKGVYGLATAVAGITSGVEGKSVSVMGRGVYGVATATTGQTFGVLGKGSSPQGWGVYSMGQMGSNGPLKVQGSGSFSSVLSAPLKLFRIDHPEDPANRYLIHFCHEGNEPLNVYSGTATLDGAGNAWVTLPAYFARINRDPRYSLTPVGAPMPMLHVGHRVDPQSSTFLISGGMPGGEVSWEVKGVRDDPWARRNVGPVEVEKVGPERGRYQNPEVYGQPPEMGLHVPNGD